ncbi:MAG TPA: GNAT family N-acetyltransferase, partial [Egibacteraceae bacterium]|nr:GNAT family N-acetyltransferase [Egibacteraceae bacterium]
MSVEAPAAEGAERIAAIEQAFETHWRHFGVYPGAGLRDEDGILWFESPIRYLPYNWVIRTRIPDDRDIDRAIARVAETFRARHVPFMWIHRPSDEPADLDHRLPVHGLDLAETATGMDLDLDEYVTQAGTGIARIVDIGDDDAGLHDYEELIRTYWSVPETERSLIKTLNRYWTGARAPGIRLVAYIDRTPIGKLFMNTEELPERVSVYGVAVKPEARGQGVARALMNQALARAKADGARRCILHSSTMALPMYRKMGFVERCSLPVYATGPL